MDTATFLHLLHEDLGLAQRQENISSISHPERTNYACKLELSTHVQSYTPHPLRFSLSTLFTPSRAHYVRTPNLGVSPVRHVSKLIRNYL